MRRGAADGVARIAAEAHGAEARGDGGRGAAARARRDAIERVGIARVAWQERPDRLVRAERELRHVGFREHDRAGLFHAPDEERVLVRDEPLERERPGRALQADGFEVVLHDHRNAVQRTGQTVLDEPSIEIVGLLLRVGVRDDDRVERGAVLVVGVDSPQVGVHERATGQAAALHGRVNLRDRRLVDLEGGRRRLRVEGCR